MNAPLISVIMPVCNSERFIGEALRSLLQEKEVNLDIIVIDDGSTDQTRSILSSIASAGPGIRILDGPHEGVSKARNIGLRAVPDNAEFITFLDSDDLNVPGSISRQLALMRQNPEIDFVVGLVRFFEAADNNFMPCQNTRTMTVKCVQLGAALFSKRIFTRLGEFDEDMPNGEDIDLFLRMLETNTRYITEDEVAVMYRRHDANMTNDLPVIRRGFMDAIRKSLARRRKNGTTGELGDLFKTRGNAEELFTNA